MHIRQAEPDDLAGLKSFDEWDTLSEETIRSGECFVAGFDERLLAFGILDRTFFKRAFVAMLFVHPDFRHRGLGSALLHHFESIVTDEKLWISTNIENLAMQRMLDKHGFELTGVVNNLGRLPELVFFKCVASQERPK